MAACCLNEPLTGLGFRCQQLGVGCRCVSESPAIDSPACQGDSGVQLALPRACTRVAHVLCREGPALTAAAGRPTYLTY